MNPLTCNLDTLCEYMDRMQMLSDPLEQSRLLEKLPEVIAEMEELEPIVQDSSIDDTSEHNSLPDSYIPQNPENDLAKGLCSHSTVKHRC